MMIGYRYFFVPYNWFGSYHARLAWMESGTFRELRGLVSKYANNRYDLGRRWITLALFPFEIPPSLGGAEEFLPAFIGGGGRMVGAFFRQKPERGRSVAGVCVGTT